MERNQEPNREHVYWVMDAEGNFGRGPTPETAMVEYLKIAMPDVLARFEEAGVEFICNTLHNPPLPQVS